MTGCADPLALKRAGMDSGVTRYRCLSAYNSTLTREVSATVQARLGRLAAPNVEEEEHRGGE